MLDCESCHHKVSVSLPKCQTEAALHVATVLGLKTSEAAYRLRLAPAPGRLDKRLPNLGTRSLAPSLRPGLDAKSERRPQCRRARG